MERRGACEESAPRPNRAALEPRSYRKTTNENPLRNRKPQKTPVLQKKTFTGTRPLSEQPQPKPYTRCGCVGSWVVTAVWNSPPAHAPETQGRGKWLPARVGASGQPSWFLG